MKVYVVYECDNVKCVFDSYSKALKYALDEIYQCYFTDDKEFDELEIKERLKKTDSYRAFTIISYEVM
jgi:hypothetical protein